MDGEEMSELRDIFHETFHAHHPIAMGSYSASWINQENADAMPMPPSSGATPHMYSALFS